MISRTDPSSPAGLQIYRLHQLLKPHALEDLHTEQETNLKTDNDYNSLEIFGVARPSVGCTGAA